MMSYFWLAVDVVLHHSIRIRFWRSKVLPVPWNVGWQESDRRGSYARLCLLLKSRPQMVSVG